MKKRVVIAMSGGVDSSVAAALLVEQGYECIGMHLRFWSDPTVSSTSEKLPLNKCCTIASLEDARRIATQLSIPFYVMNVSEPFKKKVVDYFLDGYSTGNTPNPCIQCNKNIKFGQLLSRAASLGAHYLATGHYVKKVAGSDELHELHMAVDKKKDQSYFLYHLTQKKLARILFPLGDLLKSKVYELAKVYRLMRVAEKKESQGICFFSETTPKDFLKRHLSSSLFTSGPILSREGRLLGIHRGLPLYTIGQRQGLGIGGVSGEQEGCPWYVVEIDKNKNALIVGRVEDLKRMELICTEANMISGEIPQATLEAHVRVRYHATPVPGVIRFEGETACVSLREPVIGLSPGQAAVFYDGEKVIGGGTIVRSLASTYEKETSQEARLLSTAH